MASFGWDVYGVDVSANAIEAAKAKDLKQLWCQDIFDAQLPNTRFDLITFWQSFEHLSEPLQALKKVAAFLKRDGMIFVSVPNIDSLEARMSLKSWFGLDLPRHHFLYSPGTLKRLLEAAGFKVVALSKNSLEYNVPMFMMTFLNFLRGETNWFYNFVKRHEFARTNLLLREYTVLLSIFLIPLILVFSPFLYLTNILSGNGSVIEIFARSKDV